VAQLLLGTAIALLAALAWLALRRPGWRLIRGRPVVAGIALAGVSIVSLAVSGTLIDAAAGRHGAQGSHPEGANGWLGTLYEVPSGDTVDRPATLRLALRRLDEPGGPYTIAAAGTLSTMQKEGVRFFHATRSSLLDRRGNAVRGCENADVSAFTMPSPADSAGPDGWGLTVAFPSGCRVSSGSYEEAEPMPEPAAMAGWR
jgi:hypothetical protein